MNLLSGIIDIFVHLDKNLVLAVGNYGILVYPLLFIIIFLETGLVVTPFLPGDSLIFASGTLAAKGLLSPFLLFFLLAFAAILGDTANYWIGSYFGNKISKSRFVKKEHLKRTHDFYEKYGGKAIILARFVPIIRTFAPFVAGIGKMNYSKFLIYNLIGGLLWVALFITLGFYFGNLPIVRDNFSLAILAIIFISILPAIIEYLREKYKKK